MNDESIFNFEATILPGLGVRSINIGCTVEEIENSLGRPDEIHKFGSDPFAIRLSDRDACVFYSYLSKGISIRFVSGKVESIFLYSGVSGVFGCCRYSKFDGITPKGITLDFSYDQVEKLCGPAEDKGSLELTDTPISIKSLSYKSQGIEFMFESNSDKIVSICVYACED